MTEPIGQKITSYAKKAVNWAKNNPGEAAVAIFSPAAGTIMLNKHAGETFFKKYYASKDLNLEELARQAEVLERFEKYQAEHPDMSTIEKSGILAGLCGEDIAESLKKRFPETVVDNAQKTEKEIDSATKE